MTDIALSVEGLSKRYSLEPGAGSARGVTYREAIVDGARSLAHMPGEFLRGRPRAKGETPRDFWALRDVSFDVRRGVSPFARGRPRRNSPGMCASDRAPSTIASR